MHHRAEVTRRRVPNVTSFDRPPGWPTCPNRRFGPTRPSRRRA